MKNASKKQWIWKVEKAIRHNPLKPVVINRVIFFAFNLCIRSNPNGDVLTAGILSRDELLRNVTSETYGAGVVCILRRKYIKRLMLWLMLPVREEKQ